MSNAFPFDEDRAHERTDPDDYHDLFEWEEDDDEEDDT